MKLATIRTADGDAPARSASRATASSTSAPTTSASCWRGRTGSRQRRQRPSGQRYAGAGADFAPLVPRPGKVVCVGLNYRNHIQEMGRDLPEYPTLFAKFADTLIGANDEIVLPPETEQLDWEAELAVVIGRPVRRADEGRRPRRPSRASRYSTTSPARLAVPHPRVAAGQDLGAYDPARTRTWSPRTSCPAASARPSTSRTEVDGETMQKDNTGDLLFDPVALVEYVSTMVTLKPGRRDRHRHPRRRRPRPQTADLPATRAATGHPHWRLGPLPEHSRGRSVALMTRRNLDDALGWAEQGTKLFLGALAELRDNELDLPSALPVWTRRHLVAHLAGNAEALLNLVRWAATGEETPMYSSPHQRNADIEAGAHRPAGDLRARARTVRHTSR